MHDVAIWLEPIAGALPAGSDARHEVEHERVRAEIEKLSNVRGENVDWPLIQRDGQVVLQRKAKDLLIAAYLAFAWAKLEGLAGLARGMSLLASLLERYRGRLQPQRPRARANALSWFAEHAAQLPGSEVCGAERAAELRAAYGALLASARAALGDECPSLTELGRSVERVVLSVQTPIGAPMAASDVTAQPTPIAGPGSVAAAAPAQLSATDAVSAAVSASAPAAGAAQLSAAAAVPAAVSVSASAPAAGTAQLSAAAAVSAAASGAAPVPAAVPIAAGVAAPAPVTAAFASAALAPALSAPATTPPDTLVLPVPVPAPADPAALAPFLSSTATALVDTARALFEADRTQPCAYRLLRIGLWLELENPPPAQGDGRTRCRAPDKRLREALAALLATARWDALLQQSEASLCANPLWLDTCWLSARALEALGEGKRAAKQAVENESRALIERLPQLLELRFLDGTPIASPEAIAWLRARASGEQVTPSDQATPEPPKALLSALDAALSAGDVAAPRELDRLLRAAPSARAAFQWRLALARAVEDAGKLEAALALYLGLERDVDAHRLEDWEPELARELFRGLWGLVRRKAALLPAPDAQRVCIRLARLSPLALT